LDVLLRSIISVVMVDLEGAKRSGSAFVIGGWLRSGRGEGRNEKNERQKEIQLGFPEIINFHYLLLSSHKKHQRQGFGPILAVVTPTIGFIDSDC
jgi:hypothetical protein